MLINQLNGDKHVILFNDKTQTGLNRRHKDKALTSSEYISCAYVRSWVPHTMWVWGLHWEMMIWLSHGWGGTIWSMQALLTSVFFLCP